MFDAPNGSQLRCTGKSVPALHHHTSSDASRTFSNALKLIDCEILIDPLIDSILLLLLGHAVRAGADLSGVLTPASIVYKFDGVQAMALGNCTLFTIGSLYLCV